MKAMRSLMIALFAIAVVFGGATKASAYNANDNHSIYGLYQLWVNVATDAVAITDASGNQSGDKLFGVHEKRAFLGAKGSFADGAIRYNSLFNWAGNGGDSARVVLYWGALVLGDLEVRFGRLAPFITYDASIQGSGSLLSLERSKSSRDVASAMFAGGNYGWRDLGFLFKYNAGIATIMASVTNGLGGTTSADSEYVSTTLAQTNNFGQAMMGLGVIITPMEGLRVSASYNMNKHDDVKLSAGAVVDVDRTTMSAGLAFNHASGLLVDGEYASYKADTADFGGENEIKGYWVRLGYWLMPKALVATVRYGLTETGSVDSVKDTDMTVALMYIMSAFRATLEYQTLDGEDGSSYTAEDPSLLRMRLQVGF